jgi:two-component system response regulator PilR (NtrC family)
VAAKDAIKNLEHGLEKKLDDLKTEIIQQRLAIEELEKENMESDITHVELPSTGICLDDIMDTLEKNLLLKALEKSKNKKEAAKLLNITFRSLRHRLKKHGVDFQRE